MLFCPAEEDTKLSDDLVQGGHAYSVLTVLSWQSLASQAWSKPHLNRRNYHLSHPVAKITWPECIVEFGLLVTQVLVYLDYCLTWNVPLNYRKNTLHIHKQIFKLQIFCLLQVTKFTLLYLNNMTPADLQIQPFLPMSYAWMICIYMSIIYGCSYIENLLYSHLIQLQI